MEIDSEKTENEKIMLLSILKLLLNVRSHLKNCLEKMPITLMSILDDKKQVGDVRLLTSCTLFM